MSPHDFTANNTTKRVLWIFGYGSLVWKPDFEFTSRKIGYLKGYVRRFWQGNVTHRGVPGRVSSNSFELSQIRLPHKID